MPARQRLRSPMLLPWQREQGLRGALVGIVQRGKERREGRGPRRGRLGGGILRRWQLFAAQEDVCVGVGAAVGRLEVMNRRGPHARCRRGCRRGRLLKLQGLGRSDASFLRSRQCGGFAIAGWRAVLTAGRRRVDGWCAGEGGGGGGASPVRLAGARGRSRNSEAELNHLRRLWREIGSSQSNLSPSKAVIPGYYMYRMCGRVTGPLPPTLQCTEALECTGVKKGASLAVACWGQRPGTTKIIFTTIGITLRLCWLHRRGFDS